MLCLPGYVNLQNINRKAASFEEAVISGTYSYSQSLGVKFGLEVTVGSIAATASGGFKEAESGYNSGQRETIKATTTFVLYDINIDLTLVGEGYAGGGGSGDGDGDGDDGEKCIYTRGVPAYEYKLGQFLQGWKKPYTTDWASAIKANNPAQWATFFKMHGTHVVTKVSVGGTATYSATYNKRSNKGTQSSSMEAKAGIKVLETVGVNVGVSSAQQSLEQMGMEGVKSNRSCEGGDLAICNPKNNGDITPAWIKSVLISPMVLGGDKTVAPRDRIELTAISQISKPYVLTKPFKKLGIDAETAKTVTLNAIKTYFAMRAAKCPQANGQACGGSYTDADNNVIPRGVCSPDRGRCHCSPLFRGKACEWKKVGKSKSPNFPEAQGQVVMSGQGRIAQVTLCKPDGMVNSYNAMAWNINNGPNAGLLKNGKDCAPNKVVLPRGVCITTYKLWGRWGAYGSGPSGSWGAVNCDAQQQYDRTGTQCTQNMCGTGCQIAQPYICGNEYGQTFETSWFCAYQISLQPGYKC